MSAFVHQAADPLIALGRIERDAHRKFDDAIRAISRAEEAFRENHDRLPDEERDEPGMDRSLYKAKDAAERAWEASVEKMVETPAISIAGLVVKLRHIARDLENCVEDSTTDLAASALADAVRLAGDPS
jgi:hypothetical protein